MNTHTMSIHPGTFIYSKDFTKIVVFVQIETNYFDWGVARGNNG